jgi:fermentation-respiration switch protein FrsA (DUF1100 family)
MFWSWAEKRFVFFPESEVAGDPAQAGLRFEDVYLTTDDGLRLHGWFLPGPPGVAGPNTQTWLWFHGNGGNLGTRVGQLERAHHLLGVNQFIFDYRGYGNSEGHPSERGTYIDARAALNYLKHREGTNPERIVYFGHSLGAAVAVELAADHPPMGIALVAPFSSIGDMAGLTVPFPLVGWLVRGHYDSVKHIPKVHAPLLLLHGQLDEIVPHWQGIKLYRAANRPKRFVTLHGASHNNAHHVAGHIIARALVQFRNGLAVGDVAPGYTPPIISL